jgi:hypothetical protein
LEAGETGHCGWRRDSRVDGYNCLVI